MTLNRPDYRSDVVEIPQQHRCTPCVSMRLDSADQYHPQVSLLYTPAPDAGTGQLSIVLENPWHNVELHHVSVAFITADPNPDLVNGEPAVQFLPEKGIDFGDLLFGAPEKAKRVRDIMILDRLNPALHCHVYLGICYECHEHQKHSQAVKVSDGYMLFRGVLH